MSISRLNVNVFSLLLPFRPRRGSLCFFDKTRSLVNMKSSLCSSRGEGGGRRCSVKGIKGNVSTLLHKLSHILAVPAPHTHHPSHSTLPFPPLIHHHLHHHIFTESAPHCHQSHTPATQTPSVLCQLTPCHSPTTHTNKQDALSAGLHLVSFSRNEHEEHVSPRLPHTTHARLSHFLTRRGV